MAGNFVVTLLGPDTDFSSLSDQELQRHWMEMATAAAWKVQSTSRSTQLALRDSEQVEESLKAKCRAGLRLCKSLDVIDELLATEDEAWLTMALVDIFGFDAGMEVVKKQFMRTVTLGLKFHPDKLGPMISRTGLANAQREALTSLYGRLQALARNVLTKTYATQEAEPEPPSAPTSVEARLEKRHGELNLVVSCDPLTPEEKASEVELLLQVQGMFDDEEPIIVEMIEADGSAVAHLSESDFCWLFASEISYNATYKCDLYKRDSFNGIDGHSVPLLVQDLDYAMDEQEGEEGKEEEVSLEEARDRLQKLHIDMDSNQTNFPDEKPKPTRKPCHKDEHVPKPSTKPQHQPKPAGPASMNDDSLFEASTRASSKRGKGWVPPQTHAEKRCRRYGSRKDGMKASKIRYLEQKLKKLKARLAELTTDKGSWQESDRQDSQGYWREGHRVQWQDHRRYRQETWQASWRDSWQSKQSKHAGGSSSSQSGYETKKNDEMKNTSKQYGGSRAWSRKQWWQEPLVEILI